MSVFGAYSAYYDLLYRDKDYRAETAYVQSLITRYAPGTRSVLDLGCGTGRHALLLAEHGYAVCGVDMSEHMLGRADSRLTALRALEQSDPGTPRIAADFVHSDIRSVRLKRSFDTLISMFHVTSYQTTNADLEAAILTAKLHLNPGGVFIFDCWYGPAVLTIRPSPRLCVSKAKHLR